MTLFQMHPYKALGPMALISVFFQKFQDILSDEIFTASLSWIERGMFPTSLNDTIITLVPKCDDPGSIKELRPIALCKVVYKIVATVLGSWLTA